MLRFLTQTARFLGPVLMLSSSAFAGDQPQLRICKPADANLKADSDLAEALRTAFGEPGFTDDEACLYPLQVLRYADADVLVTQDVAPETVCDTCEANLSATVLRRIPGGFKRARTFAAFGKTGGLGTVSSISPIAIGGDDAIAIESGGHSQGYTYLALDLYAFRPHGLVRLDPGAVLYIDADNSGAGIDESKSVSIDSAWSLGASNELVIEYRISDSGGQRQSRAVWSVGDSKLTLMSGAPPKEMARAVGAE
jgi:hypothetical protein